MFQWDAVWHYPLPRPEPLLPLSCLDHTWISVVAQSIGVILGLFLALMRMSRFPYLSCLRAPTSGSSAVAHFSYRFSCSGMGCQKSSIIPISCCPVGPASSSPSLSMKARTCRKLYAPVLPLWTSGRLEAAKSLGMRYSLAMRRVVLPQAARVIIPPLGNEFNNMLKTTSIASVIGLLELTGTAEVYGSQNFVIFELLIVATVWYLLLTTLAGVTSRAG